MLLFASEWRCALIYAPPPFIISVGLDPTDWGGTVPENSFPVFPVPSHLDTSVPLYRRATHTEVTSTPSFVCRVHLHYTLRVRVAGRRLLLFYWVMLMTRVWWLVAQVTRAGARAY